MGFVTVDAVSHFYMYDFFLLGVPVAVDAGMIGMIDFLVKKFTAI